MLFIHPSVDGYLDHFDFLLFMSNTFYEHLCAHIFSSLRYIPRSGISGSYNSILNILRKYHIVFQSGSTILHFHQQGMRVQFLHVLTKTFFHHIFLYLNNFLHYLLKSFFPLLILSYVCIFFNTHPMGMQWYLNCRGFFVCFIWLHWVFTCGLWDLVP